MGILRRESPWTKEYRDAWRQEQKFLEKYGGRPAMSKLDRAAQFAPFAALTGHEEVLEETAQIAASRKSVISEEIYDFP